MTALSRLDLVTTWGVIRVQSERGRLTRCILPVRPVARHADLRIVRGTLWGRTPQDRRVLLQARKFLQAALWGRSPPVRPALKLAISTPFTRRVLAALRRVPRGTTRTYGALARRVGAPRAARAVGTACGANPLPLFIPCHRVVAAGGRLGGFSAGVAWKRFLLAQECAASAPWKKRPHPFPKVGKQSIRA